MVATGVPLPREVVSSASAENVPLLHESEEGEEGTTCSSIERYYTPAVVLAVFTLLNFVTYFDRGALAGSLHALREDPLIKHHAESLSDTRSGLIVSAFMVGFMCACPLCASLSGVLPAKHIILTGMLVWGLACFTTGLSRSYGLLVVSRVLVGVGEAAFVGVTVTIVDNIAPPHLRTSWVGIFYSMIPFGTAAGITVSGLVSSHRSPLGTVEPWRLTFFAEVAVSIPLLLLVALLPKKYDVQRRRPQTDEVDDTSIREEEESYIPLPSATVALAKNVNYILVVLGFSTYCFVVGAVSVWAIPMLVQGPLDLSPPVASAIIGLTTMLAGMAGSLMGGATVDWLGGSASARGAANCQLFNTSMVLLCFPLGVVALVVEYTAVFVLALFFAVLALFCITAPVNASILTLVSPALRPYAISYSVFIIHVLGDFPSPTLAGVLSDYFNRPCARWDSASACHAEPRSMLSTWCVWDEHTGAAGGGSCRNKYQLRNALLIVFCFLLPAVPCWMTVYRRLVRSFGEEEATGAANEIVVEAAPSTESSSP